MRAGMAARAARSSALAACAAAPAEDAGRRARCASTARRSCSTPTPTPPRASRIPNWDFAARHREADSDIDLPRAREGGLDVQFWSIYVGKVEGDGRAIREALERIDAVWELARALPERRRGRDRRGRDPARRRARASSSR